MTGEKNKLGNKNAKKKRLTRAEAEELAPETYEEQIEHKGPIPREKQLPVRERHRCEEANIEWENEGAERFKLITITLPDNACPSFCTADQDCFGEAPALRAVCESEDESHNRYAKRHNSQYKTEEEIAEAKASGRWRAEESHMLEHLDRALQGEQVTWASMGCAMLIPDMNPRVIAKAKVEEKEFSFLHYNVWDWVYFFTADKVETEVAWISYTPQRHIFSDKPFYADPDSAEYINAMANAVLSTDPKPDIRFVRAIRISMDKPNKCFGGDSVLVREGNVSFGDADRCYTRLFLVDKRFDSEENMLKDIDDFETRDINFACVFGQMLGDG